MRSLSHFVFYNCHCTDDASIGGSFTNWIFFFLLNLLHWIFLKLKYFKIYITILND